MAGLNDLEGEDGGDQVRLAGTVTESRTEAVSDGQKATTKWEVKIKKNWAYT